MLPQDEFESRAEKFLKDEEVIQYWNDKEYRDIMYFLYQMHEERNWVPANIDKHIQYALESDVEELYHINRYSKRFANQRVIEELDLLRQKLTHISFTAHCIDEINDRIKELKQV